MTARLCVHSESKRTSTGVGREEQGWGGRSVMIPQSTLSGQEQSLMISRDILQKFLQNSNHQQGAGGMCRQVLFCVVLKVVS